MQVMPIGTLYHAAWYIPICSCCCFVLDEEDALRELADDHWTFVHTT